MEEVCHTVLHVIGSHLGAAMIALMVWAAVYSETAVAWKVVSASIFGASIILLYSMSAAYHAVAYEPAKRILKVCDHSSIYFLIAGSYTPFTLVTLRPEHPALAWSVFGIEWGLTLAGVVFKIFTTGRFRYISTCLYIGMGWVAIFAVKPIIDTLGGMGTMWLLLGGILYTVGAVFYLMKRIPYHHAVWHAFVLAGTICHFFCVLWHVMM
ncbi:MAG: hemolysin III family protein [Kiritimatiellae bacterium]|nr:hemolysin III family protein [Kiritimatiellia bacterium]